MTCRGGRDALERKRGLGEDERQPEVALVATRYRRSNLVTLVMLRKGNHSGEG